eukprot:2165096-Amphidinium_carterae.1
MDNQLKQYEMKAHLERRAYLERKERAEMEEAMAANRAQSRSANQPSEGARSSSSHHPAPGMSANLTPVPPSHPPPGYFGPTSAASTGYEPSSSASGTQPPLPCSASAAGTSDP